MSTRHPAPRTPRLPRRVGLVTQHQHKLEKGIKRGFASAGIQLAPAYSSGFSFTLCAKALICALSCIAYTGKNGMVTAKGARRRRTILYRFYNHLFYLQLFAEITLWAIEQRARGFRLAFRPNITADQPVLARRCAEQFPDIQFYDYTRLPEPAKRRLPNYHITFSYSEGMTAADMRHCLEHKVNIAVIFALKKSDPLPKTFELFGQVLPVLNGDDNDLRFLDPSDRCYIVGLHWKHPGKGSARKLRRAIAAGLVIDPAAQPFRLAA